MIPTKVVADEREKASGVPAELSKLSVRVYFSKLPVGDYVLTPEIAVERKTVKDFVSSVYDSRIFYQSARLSASFAKPYLFLEGNSSDVEGLVRSLRSYYGAIANVTVAYNLRVIYTANQTETAIAIAELLRHARAKPLTRMPSEVPQKGKTVSTQQLYLVSSLPGVGRRLAEKLLLKYGTPRKVMSLTTGELAMTAGIGWKRAEKVKGILDARFSNSQETQKQTRLEP
jgi:DNA excision repair protein ERCC-4